MTPEQTLSQATDCAEYYRIEAQRDGEAARDFCNRVAGRLREMGHIVEAHELTAGKRFDEEGGESVLTGLAGALAMGFQGRQYSHRGENMIGDDIAAGTIAQNPEPQMSPGMALLMIQLLGQR